MEITKNEVTVFLNEPQFTKLCKLGYILEVSLKSGTNYLYFSSSDIKSLISGSEVKKNLDENVLSFVITRIDNETVMEIVKRSPIYYELINI
jgi:hypothetical protein